MSQTIEQLISANTAALTDLAAAIREAGIGAGATSSTSTSTSTSAAKTTESDKGPFYWHNPVTNELGEAKTKAAYDKLKKACSDVIRIPESRYTELSEEAEGGGEDDFPSEDDLKEAFGGFLKIDDEAKREKRKAFVGKMIASVGAERATQIPGPFRAAAIQMLKDALAGKTVKPETLKDAAQAPEEEDEGGLV